MKLVNKNDFCVKKLVCIHNQLSHKMSMQTLIQSLIKAGRTTIDFTNENDVSFFTPLFQSAVGKKVKAAKADKAPKEDKPKKQMNSYMLFCAEARKNVDDFPDKQPKAVSRRLGELWQSLDAAQKAQYKMQADQNKRSTSAESVRADSRSASPSADKPKKPLSSYIKFSNAMRDSVKGEVSNPQDVSRRLGEMWRALSDEEKAKWKGDDVKDVKDAKVVEEVAEAVVEKVEDVKNDKNDETPKKAKKAAKTEGAPGAPKKKEKKKVDEE